MGYSKLINGLTAAATAHCMPKSGLPVNMLGTSCCPPIHDNRLHYTGSRFTTCLKEDCLIEDKLRLCVIPCPLSFKHGVVVVCFLSETLSVVSFTDLLNIIIKFYDGCESNKSEALVWGRR